jgi:hypothetical protein
MRICQFNSMLIDLQIIRLLLIFPYYLYFSNVKNCQKLLFVFSWSNIIFSKVSCGRLLLYWYHLLNLWYPFLDGHVMVKHINLYLFTSTSQLNTPISSSYNNSSSIISILSRYCWQWHPTIKHFPTSIKESILSGLFLNSWAKWVW